MPISGNEQTTSTQEQWNTRQVLAWPSPSRYCYPHPLVKKLRKINERACNKVKGYLDFLGH